MNASIYLILLCLAFVGCGKDLTEYDLDERSFGTDTIAEIETEAGIDIPDGAKGLRFHYIPPIDPVVFAKINIPVTAEKLIEQRLAALTNSLPQFPADFANGRCPWWLSNPANVVVSRKVRNKMF